MLNIILDQYDQDLLLSKIMMGLALAMELLGQLLRNKN